MAGGAVKWSNTVPVENSVAVLKKRNIELRDEPAIPLLGVPQKIGKQDSDRHLYTHVQGSIIHRN